MKKYFVSLFFLLGFCFLVFAQAKNVQAFTLKEAIQFALDNNNSVKNAKLSVEQAKARNLEIITTGLPQIAGSLDYNYYFKRPISPAFNNFFSDTSNSSTKVFNYLGSTDPNIQNILTQSYLQSKDSKFSFVLPHSLTGGFQVQQLIFDARYMFGIKASKDLMLTARLSKEMTDQEIKYAIMKAYYQAETAQEAKSLLDENLKLVAKLLEETRAIYNEGLIEELDVNRLELAEANLKSQINLQKQMAEVALCNLKFQMGLAIGDDIFLKDGLNTLLLNTLGTESAFDCKQRVEYELLNTAIRLKGYDVAQKRTGYYPALYGFMSYGWTSQTEKFTDIFKSYTQYYPDGDSRTRNNWFDQGLVGLSLKLPIFDSGQKWAIVKQAKLEQQKQRNELENFKNASELQYKVSKTNFNAALEDEANTKFAKDLSQKIFKKNEIKFKEGVGSSFELVQSETDFTTSQLKHIQSVMNLLNAKADLDKATGVK